MFLHSNFLPGEINGKLKDDTEEHLDLDIQDHSVGKNELLENPFISHQRYKYSLFGELD